jgi:plasmid stabilization system protein ParE
VTVPNFKLRPYAEADVEGAVLYYFARGPQLAFRLLAELDVAFDRIRENPRQFAFVEEPVRRVLLRRFPYSIYYVVEDETVSILGVIHLKQHPDTWKQRGGPAG